MEFILLVCKIAISPSLSGYAPRNKLLVYGFCDLRDEATLSCFLICSIKSYILSLKSQPLMEATSCTMEAISLSQMYADTSIIALQMGSMSSYTLSFGLLRTDCLALRARASTVMYIPIRFPYHASNTNDMKFMNGWNNTVVVDAIANCLVLNPSGVVESCSSFSTTTTLQPLMRAQSEARYILAKRSMVR